MNCTAITEGGWRLVLTLTFIVFRIRDSFSALFVGLKICWLNPLQRGEIPPKLGLGCCGSSSKDLKSVEYFFIAMVFYDSCCILICRYMHICMHNHDDDTIKTSDTVLRKIYLSLYLKGLCVRGSWRLNRTATYWPQLYWPWPRFFPVLLGCSIGGRGPSLSGCCFLYRILSPTHLIPNWLIRGLRAPSAGCWLSLPHLVSNWSDLQTDWISCELSYIIVQRPPCSCGVTIFTYSTCPRSRL